MGLAVLHIGFPAYFNWNTELKGLSLINRQMMQVHTLFIAITVFFMGLLCFACAGDLVSTGLGRKVCLGLAAFWSLRLGVQLFGYSPELWRGRRFETAIHILFSAIWLYLSGVFWWIGIGMSTVSGRWP